MLFAPLAVAVQRPTPAPPRRRRAPKAKAARRSARRSSRRRQRRESTRGRNQSHAHAAAEPAARQRAMRGPRDQRGRSTSSRSPARPAHVKKAFALNRRDRSTTPSTRRARRHAGREPGSLVDGAVPPAFAGFAQRSRSLLLARARVLPAGRAGARASDARQLRDTGHRRAAAGHRGRDVDRACSRRRRCPRWSRPARSAPEPSSTRHATRGPSPPK